MLGCFARIKKSILDVSLTSRCYIFHTTEPARTVQRGEGLFKTGTQDVKKSLKQMACSLRFSRSVTEIIISYKNHDNHSPRN